MRRLVAIVTLVAFLGPATAGAQGAPVCPIDRPAPADGVPLTWRGPKGDVTGVWFPYAKVRAIDKRIVSCENALGTCVFDLKVAQAKTSIPTWVWISIGAAGGALITIGTVGGWKALR